MRARLRASARLLCVLVNMSESTVFIKGFDEGLGAAVIRENGPGVRQDVGGGCVIFPSDSLGDGLRHKETLLHAQRYTHTHTQPFMHIYSLHRSVLRARKDGYLAAPMSSEEVSVCPSLFRARAAAC